MACLMALTASFLCVCVCVFSQELFLENYFESQRDHIFTNVQVLIYVFDIESRDLEVRFSKDATYSCYFTVCQSGG